MIGAESKTGQGDCDDCDVPGEICVDYFYIFLQYPDTVLILRSRSPGPAWSLEIDAC